MCTVFLLAFFVTGDTPSTSVKVQLKEKMLLIHISQPPSSVVAEKVCCNRRRVRIVTASDDRFHTTYQGLGLQIEGAVLRGILGGRGKALTVKKGVVYDLFKGDPVRSRNPSYITSGTIQWGKDTPLYFHEENTGRIWKRQ